MPDPAIPSASLNSFLLKYIKKNTVGATKQVMCNCWVRYIRPLDSSWPRPDSICLSTTYEVTELMHDLAIALGLSWTPYSWKNDWNPHGWRHWTDDMKLLDYVYTTSQVSSIHFLPSSFRLSNQDWGNSTEIYETTGSGKADWETRISK